jgi:hypothetical protein
VTPITPAGSHKTASVTSVLARQVVRSGGTLRSKIEATSPETRRFPFKLNDGTIVVEVLGEEPEWLYSVLDKLQTVAMLPPNWDSYGGASLSFGAAMAALEFLSVYLSDSATVPAVVPSSSGGIQLEWHRHAGDLEVAFTPDGVLSAFFVDATSGSAWEMEAGHIDAQQLRAAVEVVAVPSTR